MSLSFPILFGQSANKVKYDLLDLFLDDRSAGSINGTLATDGRNVRTVVDTTNKLSISGGALICSGYIFSSNDPVLKYLSNRISGRILIGSFIPNSGESLYGARFGFDDNGTDIVKYGFNFSSSSNTQIRLNSSAITIGTYSQGQKYYLACVLNNTGVNYYIKGGAFANWTFLAKDPTGSEATLYAMLSTNAQVFSSGFLAIPSQRWLPAPLFYHDPTSEADGALTVSNGFAGDGGLGAGGGGVPIVGGAVSSGKVVITPTLGDELVVNGGAESGITGWGSYRATREVTTDNPQTGVNCIKGTLSASSGNVSKACPNLDVKKWYKVEAWFRNHNLTSFYGQVLRTDSYLRQGTFRGSLTTNWTKGFGTFRPEFAGAQISLEMEGVTGNYGFVDNVSLKELGFTDLLSKLQQSITPNIILTVPLTLPDNHVQGGFCLRVDDFNSPQNYILIYADRLAGRIKVDKVESGVYTNILDQSITYSTNAELVASISGTSLSVFYNNALVGSAVTVPASTASNHALFATDESIQFGAFKVDAVGSEGQHNILDKFIPKGK